MMQNPFVICDHWSEPYPSGTCGNNHEVVNYINNPNPQDNPYSYTNNQGWNNH